MNIYVGNLPHGISERRLRTAFEMYGKVGNITIGENSPAKDSFSFCYVEMPFVKQALRAIQELNGKTLNGNIMIIKESGVSV